MKSKNVSRIKFGLTRIVALFMAAAMLTLGFASCSSDSSDGGTPFVPVNPVPTDQTQTQESEAQKEAAGSYTIGGTTYTVEKGKVTVTNSDGLKTEVGSVSSDGTIKITQNGTTTEIASATAADGTKTTTVKVETKNADGTTTTKTYTGDLSKGTLTNNDDPSDTVTVAKTETPKTDGTTNPTDTTKPSGTTNPTDTTKPTDSTTNPTGTSTNPAGSTTNPAETTTPEQQPSSGSGENQPASGSGEQPSSGSGENQPSAEATANKAAADAVIAKINAIGTVAYTAESKAKIDAARTAYNALTEAQKALVSNYGTLTTAESTYSTQKAAADEAAANQAAANAVITKISAIGTVEYTTECKAKIDAARTAYDALTQAQKDLVSNYGTLTTAESAYSTLKAAADEAAANQAAANAVTAKISAIGTVEYTTESKAKIDEARSAYNALTQAQKDLVPADKLTVLTTAESTYSTLKIAADEAATNQEAANAVITKISAIGTVEYTMESKAKIDAARTAYDALTQAQKNLVPADKLTVLTTAESTYASWTSAGGISVTIAPALTISVVKSVSDEAITLTAGEGFTGYTWQIDGKPVGSFAGATVSEDGTRLTLAKANLAANAVYQVSLSATKDGIPYGEQIAVKK